MSTTPLQVLFCEFKGSLRMIGALCSAMSADRTLKILNDLMASIDDDILQPKHSRPSAPVSPIFFVEDRKLCVGHMGPNKVHVPCTRHILDPNKFHRDKLATDSSWCVRTHCPECNIKRKALALANKRAATPHPSQLPPEVIARAVSATAAIPEPSAPAVAPCVRTAANIKLGKVAAADKIKRKEAAEAAASADKFKRERSKLNSEKNLRAAAEAAALDIAVTHGKDAAAAARTIQRSFRASLFRAALRPRRAVITTGPTCIRTHPSYPGTGTKWVLNKGERFTSR